MKAAFLYVTPAGHEPLATVRSMVEGELAATGHDDVHAFDLARIKLASCQGKGEWALPDRTVSPCGGG